jgi:hypothetical protein
MKKAGIMLVLLVFPMVALGGDELIKDFSPATFEKILKEDLKKDFASKKAADGVEYDIKDTPYFAFVNDKQKFINFYLKAKAPQGLTLAKVNAWNVAAIYSRLYMVGGAVVLEVPMTFAAGTTRNTVKHYYNALDQEKNKLAKFLGGGGD